MPTVHPTAVVDGDVELADDVVIGPHCVLTGPLTIGAGTRLLGGVYLNGPATIGAGNTLYPHTCLGFAPQSLAFDPRQPGRGLVIGDHNTLREGVTIHRAMTDEGPTTVGDHNFFMANSHAGHDTRVGSRCMLANGVLLAGHVHVGDHVILGGNSAAHQFVRVGRGVIVSGLSAAALDVPPFFLVTEINDTRSVNLVGMRRLGMSREEIDDVRWVHRTLCRQGLTLPNALGVLRERADRPLVAEYVRFIEASERGVCTGRGRARRAPAPSEAAS